MSKIQFLLHSSHNGHISQKNMSFFTHTLITFYQRVFITTVKTKKEDITSDSTWVMGLYFNLALDFLFKALHLGQNILTTPIQRQHFGQIFLFFGRKCY